MKIHFLLGTALLACSLATGPAAQKNLAIIAGKPSHPPGMHEFRAGALLLQQCLAGVAQLNTTVTPTVGPIPTHFWTKRTPL